MFKCYDYKLHISNVEGLQRVLLGRGVVSANRVEEEFIFFPVYSVLPITVWLQSVSAINVGWYLPARHSGRNLGCWGWSKIISQGDWKSQQKRAHS